MDMENHIQSFLKAELLIDTHGVLQFSRKFSSGTHVTDFQQVPLLQDVTVGLFADFLDGTRDLDEQLGLATDSPHFERVSFTSVIWIHCVVLVNHWVDLQAYLSEFPSTSHCGR